MDDDRTVLLPSAVEPAGVRVRSLDAEGDAVDQTFTEPFRIGRHPDCELRLADSRVSRHHAAIERDGADWQLRDLGSANGTLVGGERVSVVPLRGRVEVQVGRGGPRLEFLVASAPPTEQRPERPPTPRREPAVITTPPPPRDPPERRPTERRGPELDVSDLDRRRTSRDRPPPARRPKNESRARSLDEYARRYFGDDDAADAGEHTRMIRRAFAAVKTKQKRRHTTTVAACVLVAVGLSIYVGLQWRDLRRKNAELARLRQSAGEIFDDMKALDVRIARIHAIVGKRKDIAEELRGLEEDRRRAAKRYEGYINELGVYRKLSDEERLIYRVARTFNEAELTIPASFVHEVQKTMREYWLTPAGRGRFASAIQQAIDRGYIAHIAEAMRSQGLPSQFLYLGLQESNLNPGAVGIPTRWGRAKGMWQFIPATARRYGLELGPTPNDPGRDSMDERHDFEKSTLAAAAYLNTIYRTLAQASGLLLMASYNWGEHRIVDKLDKIASPEAYDAHMAALFEGIPEDPRARTYWNFLVNYKARMPDETKDYVLKIVSAAVIGEDPRRFGIDMDNPLAEFVDTGAEGRTALVDVTAFTQ